MVNLEELDTYSTVPIGFPIANKRVYILDQKLELLPVGVVGEIYISGIGLARGYFNKPELTAEKFIPNPFDKGMRMYKTGDLGKWLHNESIEFVGRSDHQVKIRGFRIELGEIEAKIADHISVKEVAVLDRIDKQGRKYLCAYVVSVNELSFAELRKDLRSELPDYMVPTHFVRLDALPLTHNGKLDRQSLLEIDVDFETEREYIAPESELEKSLAKIWSEVLGIEQIGITDNFFELGGESLKATKLVLQVYKELNVEVPLREIFLNPTIKDLKDYISSLEESVYSTIQPVEVKEYYSLSSAQKRLYILNELDKQSVAYNMPGLLNIEGKLDKERLAEAFKTLIKRHESLCTSIKLIKGEPVQFILQDVDFEIEDIIGGDGLEESVKDFIHPFDLEQAPLLRVGLIQISPENHKLLVDMHHIISDGVSMDILMTELIQLYQGNQLPELRIQYKDFADWQNELFLSEKLKKQEEYWLERFLSEAQKNEIPILNLPTDYPRPAVKNYAGDRIKFEISEELSKRLDQLAVEHGVTVYMLLLGAYSILLSNYSGQEDIIIGSPIAGRSYADLENIIGMFVNTLVMRTNPSGKKSFDEFLLNVREMVLEVYENQDYQFEKLVEQLELQRDMSRNPLFDVMFNMQNNTHSLIQVDGLKFVPCELEHKTAKFDLNLTAVKTAKEIIFTLEYSTELFKRETIERLSRHFVNIVREITAKPRVKLATIEMLTNEEKDQILFAFNQTHVDYPKSKLLTQLFEEQVEKSPKNIALIYEDNEITYQELNKLSNQLARYLRLKGVKPDQTVGIMVDRSLEMMIGIFGILKAGAAYLPIDPDYPKDRIEYMLSDSQTNLLLIDDCLCDSINFNGEIIDLKDEKMYVGGDKNLELVNKATDLVYIIYTSGSTGKPKGVMIEHRNVVNILVYLHKKYPFSESDAYLLKTAYTFDVSVTEIFGWFLGNGKLIIPNKGVEKDAKALVKLIDTYGITHINFVPSMLRIILNVLDDAEIKTLNQLKYIFVAGEAFPKNLAEEVSQLIPNVAVENIYGPTEATIYNTCYSINELTEQVNVPIGKPVQNTQLYILSEYGNLQPIGVVGELHIAGAGVSRGYLNRRELTDEKFIQNYVDESSKMYKSGDLARWLADGNIEYLGRVDNQVKIRGFRIELGEIENQVLKYNPITAAAVIAQKDLVGEKNIVGYYVSNEEISLSDLRNCLAKELPEYMIPAYFVRIDQIPLNHNGKLDRKALPKPTETISSVIEYNAPETDLEKRLAEIWSEILGVEKIGINHNFFELGGHSLKAMTFVARLFKEINVELPLHQVFKTPTIKELAEFILTMEKTESIRTINSVEKRDYYPLSSAQRRLYVLDQLEEMSTVYNMPFAMQIEGNLDFESLDKAFIKLIERHETLRTSFEFISGEAVQVINEQVDFNIDYVNLVSAKSDLKELIDQFIKPYDLSCAPLFRVKLIKLKESYLLILDMHHIISDGISMKILIDDLTKLYAGNDLLPTRIQYKDFAVWQNEFFNSDEIKNQEEFWLKTFDTSDEIPVLNLPTDFSRPSVMSFAGDVVEFGIDADLTAKLNQLSTKIGGTLYMTLLAGFNVLLSKYSPARYHHRFANRRPL